MVVGAKKAVMILTQNLNTAVDASNKIVLDAISSVGTRVTGAKKVSDSGRSGGTDSVEVRAAVTNLQTMLEAQNAKIDEMAELGKQTSWTDVVRNKSEKKGKGDKQIAKPAEPALTQHRGTHPPAILVDVSREDFPELAKKIRGVVCRDIIGNCIAGMKQSKSGSPLIKVRGNTDKVSMVRAEIARSAAAEIGVRTLQQRELLEVRDLDQ